MEKERTKEVSEEGIHECQVSPEQHFLGSATTTAGGEGSDSSGPTVIHPGDAPYPG